jgi:hypothetical protein
MMCSQVRNTSGAAVATSAATQLPQAQHVAAATMYAQDSCWPSLNMHLSKTGHTCFDNVWSIIMLVITSTCRKVMMLSILGMPRNFAEADGSPTQSGVT